MALQMHVDEKFVEVYQRISPPPHGERPDENATAVDHSELKVGQRCPSCKKGKLSARNLRELS